MIFDHEKLVGDEYANPSNVIHGVINLEVFLMQAN